MGYVNKIQIDEDATHLIEPTLYGTCSTAAATAIKDVTLDSFTLIPGVQIAVKFTVTNTAAASSLKLRVNSSNADDAKPIKYRGADLPDKGTLANKRVYLFLYDGTNWEFIGDIDTDTNTNTVQRTFRSSSNVELPIAGINASNSATATYNTSSSISSGSYASMYAAIPNTVANLATINPSTGKITVPGGVVADVTGNASTATNADKVDDAHAINGTFLYRNSASITITGEGLHYIKIETDTRYYGPVIRFYIVNNYSNIQGATEIDVYSRTQKFYARVTSYNGNNIRGWCQPSLDNNLYYLSVTGPTSGEGVITVYCSAGDTLTLTEDSSLSNASYTSITAGTVTTSVPIYGRLYGNSTNVEGTIAVSHGGTNITTYTVGDILYASAATTLSKLNGNTTTTRKFLRSVATTAGTAVAPAWDTLTADDIPSLNYLPLAGGTMTGNIRRYYSDASTEPMITMLSNNQDILLWEAGHGTAAATTTTSNHYKLMYKGTGSDSNNSNYLQLIAHKSSDLIAVQIDEVGNVSLPQMNKGSATKPIYLNNGVITEGTALKALAYKDSLVSADIPNNAANTSGNAATTTITTHTNTTNGNKYYYLPFLTATSGSLGLRAHSAVYLYETVSNGAISKYDFCFGASTIQGSITLWDGSSHWGNISTTNLSSNRTYTLPNASGTIALTSSDITGNAATATQLSNFVVSTYTIPVSKGVRIQYPIHAPVIISCQESLGGGRLILIGGGYGEEGTVRNNFTEVVSCSTSILTWSLPQTTGLPRTIEILNMQSGTTATVYVWSTASCTFTEITSLVTEASNRTLLHSNNYKTYAWARPSSITDGKAIISNGTDGSTTLRDITNNTTAGTAITANTNLVTANTVVNWSGSSNISTVGTITSGIWNGSVIGAAYGGTGQNTLALSIKSLLGALTEATGNMATTDYVVTKGVGTSDTYYIRAVSHIITATNVKAALGTDSSTTNQWLTKKGTWSTPTATQVGALPVNYSAPDFSVVTTTNGVYPLAGTNPVTNATEYGGVLQFGASTSNANYYAAQLIVSAVSGATSPVHAYIRRMTSTPAWSDWSTLLDDKNTTAPSSTPTLSWNTESTVFTLNGSAVKIKAMSKPTYAFTDLTSHPTTLSGYGITDAKIASGVITLGSNTITPINAITSTDNAIVRFDGANGQVQDSGIKIDDNDNITGFNSFKYNTKYYPFIKEFHSRTKWYKITFPYSTATTDSSSAKWFMNSFDIHIGGGYSANAAGVIHVTFYWSRAKDNGAWTVSQASAKFDGILMNKVKLYYRIAEPGVLYVNNESNTYNGVWITDLYNDDTAPTLDWTTTTITSCDAITSSTDPALSAYTQIPSVYTYTNNSTTYCIDNLTQLTKNLILYASSGNSPALIFKRASDSTLTDWRIYVTDGKLSFCTALDGATWTERASFADNSGNFTVTGTMTATNFYGGGANITLGTASAAVVTDANKKLTTRGIKNITGSANNLEWTSSSTDNTLVTTNTLAYWNGRYNSTSSNLAYCNKGAFGTIITNNFPTSNTTTTYLRGDGSWVSLSDMGLSTAMHYKGTVEASPITTAPTGTFAAGDVVVYDNSEYVYDGTSWRELGSESSFKTIQDAVSSPSVPSSGTTTATAFIDTISQDANGVITATKKNLPTASTSVAGIIQIGTGASNAMAGNTTVTNVAISANVTTNANYPIVFATSNKDTTTAKNEGLQKSGAKFYFNPNSATLSINNGTTTGTLTATNYSGKAATAGAADYAGYLSTPSITTEADIASGTRSYQGSGSTWTGNITSMTYAGILQVCGGYSRGWQIWATRGDTNHLHWRNPNADANAWLDEMIILDSGNYNTYAAAKSHTHGDITNDGKLTNANRLVWTDGDKKIYAGYHYANSTKVAINSSSEPTENLYVSGKIQFNVSTTGSGDKNFIIKKTNDRYLSIGCGGLQSYNANNTVGTMWLQYSGGTLEIGTGTVLTSTTYNATTANITWTTANMTGAYNFKTANTGFNFSGMGAGSDNVARNIWFSYNGQRGTPVYDDDFKYNPSTNTITIGSGTLNATNYSGNAASATQVAAKLAATTKTYLLGTSTTITGTAANVDLIGDTGIYATTTAGELSAVRHSFNVSGTEKAYITYNSTDNSLDFVFV